MNGEKMTEAWRQDAKKMVNSQIRARGVKDERVLEVMRNTPRHMFVPENNQENAWRDYPLPIGGGQTISQPYIVGLMTELLELKGREKVLEIGTGSGYQAAVLAQLADSVYSIEVIDWLASQAAEILDSLGYHNVTVKHGDGYQGWPEQAPFDAIIVTAAPPELPEALIDQLKPGGVMVVPVGDKDQELLRIHKFESYYETETILGVRFVPMVEGEEED